MKKIVFFVFSPKSRLKKSYCKKANNKIIRGNKLLFFPYYGLLFFLNNLRNEKEKMKRQEEEGRGEKERERGVGEGDKRQETGGGRRRASGKKSGHHVRRR